MIGHVIIIGGGIAGLATAYYLQRQSEFSITYTLVESGRQFGGKIVTEQTDGLTIEGGPDSFIMLKPWANDLCADLRLQDRLIGSQEQNRQTYVLQKNCLRPLPDGFALLVPTRLMPFITSPLFSPWGKLRMALDWVLPAAADNGDVSVGEFVSRRLGREAVEKIAEPLLAGIYGADPDCLSLRTTFPRFLHMEQKYGSLIKAALANRRRAAANGERPPLFMALRGGMYELVDALVKALRGTLITGDGVARIQYDPAARKRFQVHLGSGRCLAADAIVMATPAFVAAELLAPLNSALAERLRAIRYHSSATVSLAYAKAKVNHKLAGYGFVVPKREECRLLACSWVSSKFADRAPTEKVLLRAFLGGYRNEELLDFPDEHLIRLVRDEFKQVMNIDAAPDLERVYRWPKGNVQYDVGHQERIDAIEKLAEKSCVGLHFAGCAYRGGGIPNCIYWGRKTAERVVEEARNG